MKQANVVKKLNYVSKFSHEFDISKAQQFKDEFQDKNYLLQSGLEYFSKWLVIKVINLKALQKWLLLVH